MPLAAMITTFRNIMTNLVAFKQHYLLPIKMRNATPSLLSDEQIHEFRENGVLVVPNVLSSEEIAEARRGLHYELAKYGVVSGRLYQC